MYVYIYIYIYIVIVKQILIVSTKGSAWRTVLRIYKLMLRCKGLIGQSAVILSKVNHQLGASFKFCEIMSIQIIM